MGREELKKKMGRQGFIYKAFDEFGRLCLGWGQEQKVEIFFPFCYLKKNKKKLYLLKLKIIFFYYCCLGRGVLFLFSITLILMN